MDLRGSADRLWHRLDAYQQGHDQVCAACGCVARFTGYDHPRRAIYICPRLRALSDHRAELQMSAQGHNP